MVPTGGGTGVLPPPLEGTLIIGYKLFDVRSDGSLQSLYVDRTRTLPEGRWLEAKDIKVQDRAYRPGWHACSEPKAPHLRKAGRVWKEVWLKGAKEHTRPDSQGGLWYTARKMLIVP